MRRGGVCHRDREALLTQHARRLPRPRRCAIVTTAVEKFRHGLPFGPISSHITQNVASMQYDPVISYIDAIGDGELLLFGPIKRRARALAPLSDPTFSLPGSPHISAFDP